MATLDQVIAQMLAADMPRIEAHELRVDGRVHRYGREKKAWYVLHEFLARNGRRVVTGAFGFWRGTDNGAIKVQADWQGIEPDEYQRLQRSHAAHEARERAKREARARFAGGRARQQWQGGRARLAEGGVCEYLARKRLAWENGLRMLPDGVLAVPMVRYDVTEDQESDPAYTGPRRLAGLQKISPDGAKRFSRGMDPTGTSCRFGPKPKDGDVLLVGEGLATVLSALQALERQYAAFVAFTAGNLLPVARILRALYPKSPILFLADDDAYLEAQLNKRLQADYGVRELYKVLDAERTMSGDAGPVSVRADLHEDSRGTPLLIVGVRAGDKLRTFTCVNAGRTKAWDAAGAVGNAWVAWPVFADRALAPDPQAARRTDWNDLHCAEGVEPVVAQLGDALKSIEDAHQIARALAGGTPAAPEGASPAGGKGGGDEPDWQLHGALRKRFTLVERTGNAWDAERGFMWKIEHMRLSYGVRAVNMWLASPRTRKIDASQVVFDPSGSADPERTINLFRGLQVKPREASCERVLQLLRYLCGEDGDQEHAPISEWVLKWCAYQVQHVGAKMRTAIVMHGPEGTGKNQFWSVMQDIFHPYSAQIGQSELEDKFNGWLSARLFLLANEVVTRAEMSHHVGKLKAYVTEPYLHIRTAYMDARYEQNHANIVFLSNELQPLKISPGDRRYMVIRTPPVMPREFYEAVAAELRAGGAAGFLRHLLAIDLGDFNEHTKPIFTEAKRDLIEIGMLPSQLFWQEIKDGLVPLPYCPALTDDVYRAYVLWCLRRGHKMPEAQQKFAPSFMSMNGVRRVEDRVADPDRIDEIALAKHKLRKRRVFYMGPPREILHLGDDEPAKYESHEAWVNAGLKAFRSALRAFEAESPASGAADRSGGRARSKEDVL